MHSTRIMCNDDLFTTMYILKCHFCHFSLSFWVLVLVGQIVVHTIPLWLGTLGGSLKLSCVHSPIASSPSCWWLSLPSFPESSSLCSYVVVVHPLTIILSGWPFWSQRSLEKLFTSLFTPSSFCRFCRVKLFTHRL